MTESTLSTIPTEKPVKIGRLARQSVVPIPWSVRSVESDTRRVIEKSAERAVAFTFCCQKQNP